MDRARHGRRAGLRRWDLFNWWRQIQRNELIPGRWRQGAPHDYIRYYNVDRIKLGLGGLSPVAYRMRAAAAPT
jgi:hypothetical protein